MKPINPPSTELPKYNNNKKETLSFNSNRVSEIKRRTELGVAPVNTHILFTDGGNFLTYGT